jgi:cyclic beta-1,2-glucan synthetase
LSGTLGHTLDPVVALQGRIRLEPGARCRIAFTTIAAGSRETALDLARRYGDEAAFDWALDEARRAAAALAGELSLDHDDVVLAQRLASRLLTGDGDLRPSRPPIAGDLAGQPALWSMGVSGDLPILVLSRADDTLRPDPAKARPDPSLVAPAGPVRGPRDPARGRGGLRGTDAPAGLAAMREAGVIEGFGERGGIHLRASGQIDAPALAALRGMARVWIDGTTGSLDGCAAGRAGRARASAALRPRRRGALGAEPRARPARGPRPSTTASAASPRRRDYVIQIEPGGHTPQPWSNVIANDRFGCVVTEAGGGFTWAVNSGENRLTPWSNDAVGDPPGEAVYLRDEETAAIWSVTPAPCGGGDACRVTHSRPARRNGERQPRPAPDPDRPCRPRGAGEAVRPQPVEPRPHVRRITATLYAEWVLGAVNEMARPHVVCDYDTAHRALLARSGWNPEFAARVAFLTASRAPHSLTCNRTAFLGPEGDRARPAGLVAWDLGGQVRDVTDPCAAYQVHLDIAPGATERVVFALGQGDDLAMRWRSRRVAGPRPPTRRASKPTRSGRGGWARSRSRRPIPPSTSW